MPSKIYRCRRVGLMRIDRKWKSWEESIRRHPCTVVDCRFGSAELSVWWTQSISHIFPDIIPLSSRVCHLFCVFVTFQTLASRPRHIRSTNIQPISIPPNILGSFIDIINQREASKSVQILQELFSVKVTNAENFEICQIEYIYIPPISVNSSQSAVKWWIVEQIQSAMQLIKIEKEQIRSMYLQLVQKIHWKF